SPYKTFRVDVPRGSHSFDWIYKKDFSTSHGEDRARLQLLEISGSDYADRECHNCFGISSNAADGRCEQCERDEYAEVVSTSSRCVPCPAGYWASPGSVGSSSCHERRACTAQDVEATYAAIQDTAGQGGATPGPICRGNLTMARVRWRQPMTCNPKRPGSIALQDVSSTGELGEQQPCPPCQPHEWRPTGSACEPLRSQSCPPGLHALPERVVSYWHVWPRNFTGWIWGAGGEDTEDQSHGWQLSRNGAAAVVGTAFIGGGGAEIVSLINSEARADQACLTMDVTLESRGVLRFFVEVQPSWAWGQAAALYVDHEPRIVQFSEDEEEPAAVREIVLNLEAGQHAITWVWRYDWAMEDDEEPGDSDYGVELDEEEVKVETAPAGSGLRLLNISVTNVAGAGSGSCRHCPAGQGLPSPSSATCQPCPPGRSSTDYTSGIAKEDSGTCKPCPAGRSSSGDGGLGSESCRDCGPGLQSLEGAGYCEPLASIGHWSSHAIEAAWHIGQAAVLNSASNSGLRMVRIEDRVFYIDLFTPRQRPDGPSFEFEAEGATATAASQPLASLAFWWEWLPPREELIGYLDSGCEARGGSYVRAVGDVIEGIDVADPSADGPTGLWASFSGLCEETGSAPRVRRAQIFLHCDLFQSPEDLSLSFMDGMRPSSEDGRSCEDFALEWRTSAACPVCSESSWRPVFAGGCEETGRKVTYMADPPCSGGAPAPKDRWQPCPGPVDLLMLGHGAQKRDRLVSERVVYIEFSIFNAHVFVSAVFVSCMLCIVHRMCMCTVQQKRKLQHCADVMQLGCYTHLELYRRLGTWYWRKELTGGLELPGHHPSASAQVGSEAFSAMNFCAQPTVLRTDVQVVGHPFPHQQGLPNMLHQPAWLGADCKAQHCQAMMVPPYAVSTMGATWGQAEPAYVPCDAGLLLESSFCRGISGGSGVSTDSTAGGRAERSSKGAISKLQEFVQSSKTFPLPSSCQVLQWSHENRMVGSSLQFRASTAFILDGVPHHVLGGWWPSKKQAQRDTAERALSFFVGRYGEELQPQGTLVKPLNGQGEDAHDAGQELSQGLEGRDDVAFLERFCAGQRLRWSFRWEATPEDPLQVCNCEALCKASVELEFLGAPHMFTGRACSSKVFPAPDPGSPGSPGDPAITPSRSCRRHETKILKESACADTARRVLWYLQCPGYEQLFEADKELIKTMAEDIPEPSPGAWPPSPGGFVGTPTTAACDSDGVGSDISPGQSPEQSPLQSAWPADLLERKTAVMRLQNQLQKMFSKQLTPGMSVWSWRYEKTPSDATLCRASVHLPFINRTFTGDWAKGHQAAQLLACHALSSFLAKDL
ncbi:unnamed protein product, partial [Polarella glacialis]